MKPGTDKLIHTSLRQREHGPGLHPVILKVRYHDANQYPFSTLTYGLYQVGDTGEAGGADKGHSLGRN